jgi:hypothetical protein
LTGILKALKNYPSSGGRLSSLCPTSNGSGRLRHLLRAERVRAARERIWTAAQARTSRLSVDAAPRGSQLLVQAEQKATRRSRPEKVWISMPGAAGSRALPGIDFTKLRFGRKRF